MIKYIFFMPFLLLLFAASYADTLQWMLGRYLSPDSYYSHGFLVPLISGYLIWLKKDDLARVPPRTSWIGFLLVVMTALLHVFGTAVYVFSVSGFSIWLLVVGAVLFLNGWERTRIILFPLFYLIFMFPVPLAFITRISFPLKMFVAAIGVKLVALTGIPIFREGFNVLIPQGTLIIGNPCSGLRSLIAFLALGSVFAYMSELSVVRKWVLALIAVPVALMSNLIRVPILILWSYWFGLDAAAPDTWVHTGSGMVVFVLGMGMLYFCMHCLSWSRREV